MNEEAPPGAVSLVARLFEALFDQTRAEQEAQLAALEDPAVAHRVRVLLDADVRAQDLFGTLGGAQALAADLEASLLWTVEEEPDRLVLPERYSQARLIGSGGMGKVYRVWDRDLERFVALKTTAGLRAQDLALHRRFRREAMTTAALQHPGVIAVHAAGVLEDGRPFYTMPVVQGDELSDVVQRHHTSGDPSLRALVQILRRACEPLAHAHASGIVHRDLKPGNVMIGAHGEVLVVDWGVARAADVVSVPDAPVASADFSSMLADEGGERLTQDGILLGTPAYMAPEQVGSGALTPATDVYALGGVLVHILNGQTPREGSIYSILHDVLEGVPIADIQGPVELVDIAQVCLAHHPADRPSDAGEVAALLDDWLDGTARAAEAAALLDEAEALQDEVREARVRALQAEERAEQMLAAVGPWASEAEKAPAFEQEEVARRARQRAERARHEAEIALWTALSRDASHSGARSALASHHRAELSEARRRRDADAITRAEVALEAQLPFLMGVERQDLQRFLAGRARIQLDTHPSGASVVARPQVRKGRRLVPGAPVHLGSTPLDTDLAPGSWVLELSHPACETATYPVWLEPDEPWDSTPPGSAAALPVPLLRAGSLEDEDRYVPPGWFLAGATDAPMAVPPTRMWCDGFVARSALVTNAEYLVFLDALVAAGRREDSIRFSPRDYQRDEPGVEAPPIWALEGDRWRLRPDSDGDLWGLDWPVVMVDVPSALAYIEWYRAHTGLAWRFAADFEWEKMARGVDGRRYPWGDGFDRTFASMELHDGESLVPAAARPVDCSVYGVHQLAGSAAEWCLEERADEPVGQRVRIEALRAHPTGHRARGGSWHVGRERACCAARGFAPTWRGLYNHGFRIVRSV